MAYSNKQYFVAGKLCSNALRMAMEEDIKGNFNTHTERAKKILKKWKTENIFPDGVPEYFFDYYITTLSHHPDILDCH